MEMMSPGSNVVPCRGVESKKLGISALIPSWHHGSTHLTQLCNRLCHPPQVIPGITILHHLTIDLGPQLHIFWVPQCIARNEDRANGQVAVKGLAQTPLDAGEGEHALSRGDVVGERVAQDVGEGFRSGDVFAWATDDHTLCVGKGDVNSVSTEALLYWKLRLPRSHGHSQAQPPNQSHLRSFVQLEESQSPSRARSALSEACRRG